MSQAALPTNSAARPTPGARNTDPVSAGRVPPQDLDAEASLLGSMLLDRDLVGLVLQIIPREEASRFYRPDHRQLYEVLIDLYDQNKPMDLLVLEDELRRRGLLEEIGGREYLIDLSESVASAANCEYYARIVRDKSLLRDLIQCGGQILQDAYDASEPANVVLDDAEKRLFEVTEKRVTNQAVPIREFLQETLHQIEAIQDGRLTGVASGFNELDDLLGGFQFGDFIVVAARPSMGKTALALSMLDYIAVAEKIPAAFFSLEMSKLQIAQRMLCSHAHVDMQKLRSRKLSDQDRVKLKTVGGKLRDYGIYIDDTPAMSVMEVRAKARRLKMLHKIEIIFVDYLQLMFDRASKENRQQEIAAISRGLKSLARELNIPVVALAQLNRQVEGRDGNRPRMSDLRESGAIEQDADVVVLLHREEYYQSKKRSHQGDGAAEPHDSVKGQAELIVAKQRNGPVGTVKLHFTSQFARFDNATPDYIHDDPGGFAGGVTNEIELPVDDSDEPAPF